MVQRKLPREYYGAPTVAALVLAHWHGFARRRLLASAAWYLFFLGLLVAWLVGGWLVLAGACSRVRWEILHVWVASEWAQSQPLPVTLQDNLSQPAPTLSH